MHRLLLEQLTLSQYALIAVVGAGGRCCQASSMPRRLLDRNIAVQAASDWRAFVLTVAEKAALAYTGNVTFEGASVR